MVDIGNFLGVGLKGGKKDSYFSSCSLEQSGYTFSTIHFIILKVLFKMINPKVLKKVGSNQQIEKQF